MGIMYQMRPEWAARPSLSSKVTHPSGIRNVNLAYPGVDYASPVYILTL